MDAEPTDLNLLLVGDFSRAEFADAVRLVQQQAKCNVCPTLDQAVHSLSEFAVAVDLIIVAQARPGLFTDDEIARLRRFAPTTPIIALLGSWCEGEPRTGKPLAGVTRVYWYDWPAQCTRALEQLRGGRCGDWGLPATSTEEQRLMHSLGMQNLPGRGLIAICSPYRVSADALASACSSGGYATYWIRPGRPSLVSGACAGIWDGAIMDEDEATGLFHFAGQIDHSPVLALLDFPRIEAQQRAQAAGANTVLPKPFCVDDLLWQLHRATGSDSLAPRVRSGSAA